MGFLPPKILETIGIYHDALYHRADLSLQSGEVPPYAHHDIRALFTLARILKTNADYDLRHAPPHPPDTPSPSVPHQTHQPHPSHPTQSAPQLPRDAAPSPQPPNAASPSTRSLLSPSIAAQLEAADEAALKIAPFHYKAKSMAQPGLLARDVQRLSRLVSVHLTLAEAAAHLESETVDPHTNRDSSAEALAKAEAFVALALDLPLPKELEDPEILARVRSLLEHSPLSDLPDHASFASPSSDSDPRSSASIGGQLSASSELSTFDTSLALSRLDEFYESFAAHKPRPDRRDPRLAQRLRIKVLPPKESPVDAIRVTPLNSRTGASPRPGTPESPPRPSNPSAGQPTLRRLRSILFGPPELIPHAQACMATDEQPPEAGFSLLGKRLLILLSDEICDIASLMKRTLKKRFGRIIDLAPRRGSYALLLQRCAETDGLPP